MLCVKPYSAFDLLCQVEMFGVTADETGQESSQMLDEFVSLQKEIFSSLKLHFRLLCNLVCIVTKHLDKLRMNEISF